jgi:hypothetical protein
VAAGLKPSVDILEITHIKGVSIERGYNPFFEMTTCDQSQVWRGLITFQANRDAAKEKGYVASYLGMASNLVLRVYAMIRSPYVIKAIDAEGRSKQSSYTRFLTLENELYKPPIGAQMEVYGEDILKLYTPKKWIISDIDAQLKGNPILPKYDSLKHTYVY